MLAILRAFFLVSLLFLSFIYGLATIELQIFPYSLVRESWIGLKAWRDVLSDGILQTLPPAFIDFDANAAPRPVVKPGAGPTPADDGLILISGSPYQLGERCPDFGCIAWLVDREGRIAHSWEVDWNELWGDTGDLKGRTEALNVYPIGMHLFDNGDLLVTFQAHGTFPFAAGIARLDRNGRILWKHVDHSHHWPTADKEGRIYVPALRLADSPLSIGETPAQIDCDTEKIYDDVIRVLSPDGEVLREYSILKILADSDYAGLIRATHDTCDPTHLNAIDLVTPQVAAQIPGVAPGDLLISLRNVNAIAILDHETGAVKRLVAGRTIAQHGPRFLPDGSVLVLDNLGGLKDQGGTRIVRLNMVTGALHTVYPPPGADLSLPFYTKAAGQIDIAADGRRALIALTHRGRVLELDVATGAVLWEYVNSHDIGRFIKHSGLGSWFLQAVGLAQETTTGTFETTGAYYVGRPAFLN